MYTCSQMLESHRLGYAFFARPPPIKATPQGDLYGLVQTRLAFTVASSCRVMLRAGSISQSGNSLLRQYLCKQGALALHLIVMMMNTPTPALGKNPMSQPRSVLRHATRTASHGIVRRSWCAPHHMFEAQSAHLSRHNMPGKPGERYQCLRLATR